MLPSTVSDSPPRSRFEDCSAHSDDVRIFERLFEDEISVCVWRRDPDPELTNYVRRVAPSLRPTRRERVSVRSGVSPIVLSDFPEAPQKRRLLEDLRGLVDLFATLADVDGVGVRIVCMNAPMCPRFHTDRVSLRLLCTWLGPGTEWVERSLLDEMSTASSLSPRIGTQSEAETVVHRMRCFDIGVFKGELWPRRATRAVLHRSPPLGSPTEHRVIVSLDAL